MSTNGTQRGGWATAQEPCLISDTPRRAPHVDPALKHREAELLRAAVEAHIRAGGDYENLNAVGGESR